MSTSERPGAAPRSAPSADRATTGPGDTRLEDVVLTRIIRLNARVQGLVMGLLGGLVIFVATNWLVLKGGPVVGPHLGLLAKFFIGYSVTFVGSLVGFAYGFATGFVAGYFVAIVYNFLVIRRTRA